MTRGGTFSGGRSRPVTPTPPREKNQRGTPLETLALSLSGAPVRGRVEGCLSTVCTTRRQHPPLGGARLKFRAFTPHDSAVALSLPELHKLGSGAFTRGSGLGALPPATSAVLNIRRPKVPTALPVLAPKPALPYPTITRRFSA